MAGHLHLVLTRHLLGEDPQHEVRSNEILALDGAELPDDSRSLQPAAPFGGVLGLRGRRRGPPTPAARMGAEDVSRCRPSREAGVARVSAT
jgi:hypothetical protein